MRDRHILLINPWIYDFAAYDLWAKPLGLLGLGAILKANGCRVSLLDCLTTPHPLMNESLPNRMPGGRGKYYRQVVEKPAAIRDVPRHYARYGISPDAFAHDIAAGERPDAVLVTSLMTYWYPGVIEAIRMVKEAFPGVPVILGGIYATLCRDHALRFSGADHVVSHEGEGPLLALLAGLWGASPTFTPDREDLDSLPYPLFGLAQPLRYVVVQTSRGCPYRCTYCASHILSPGMRRRAFMKVADEVEFWVKTQRLDHFAFYDDAFLFQKDKLALPLMKEIIRRGLDVRFHCPNALHARCIDLETARAMKESGFSTIRLGLETADQDRQTRSGGKVTNAEFLAAVENLETAGFNPGDVGAYILCGLPGQQAREVMDAVRFVQSSGARPVITEYSPLPGTGDWEEACRASRYPLAEDPLYHNNSLLPCSGKGLSFEDYKEIRQEAGRSGQKQALPQELQARKTPSP
jgi:radical SAM superfamily enzyme YgiQ (UPF0313 family)